MVSDLIIRSPAVANVSTMPMYWSIIVSMALGWVQKFYSFYKFYVYVWVMYWSIIVSMALGWVQKFYSFYKFYVYVWVFEMMKTKFPELCNPKDPHITTTLGKYKRPGGMIDEAPSDLVNKRYTAFVQTWDLSRIFNVLDSDGDGRVTAENVQRLLEKLGIQNICDDSMKIMMGSLEHMNFDDFCGFLLNMCGEAHEHAETEEKVLSEDLEKAFSIFDKNGDGFISPIELQQVLLSLGLKEGKDLESCEMMITRFDRNLDGRIDFEEFENMMTMKDKSL